MRGPRIALVVDHPQRDLAGLVLVALVLVARGVTCHLVPVNRLHELWALAPDFVLLNYFRRGIEPLARRLTDAGIGIGVLDTEGGVWADVDSYVELLWSDAALRRRLRPVCMWGPALAAAVVERGLLLPEQVVVTGCPRFDFYHRRWRAATAGAAPAHRAVAPVLLLNTNFSFGNPRFTSREGNAEQLRRDFGWSPERVREYMDTEWAAIDEMIRLARRLAGDFPAVDVLLRPHPFEDPRPYESALGDLARVTVDPSGPVQSRIFAAAAVIQRSCSTAVEAGLAGVPALSPQWIVPPVTVPVAEMASHACGSYDELRAVIGDILAGTYVAAAATRANVARVAREWFHAIDGQSHLRVADAVWRALGQQPRADLAACRRHLYGLHDGPSTHWATSVARRVRHTLRLGPDWSFRQWRQVAVHDVARADKHFDATMVRALVARILAAGAPAANAGSAVPAAVQVAAAAERGDFRSALDGRSVTLAPAVSRGQGLWRAGEDDQVVFAAQDVVATAEAARERPP